MIEPSSSSLWGVIVSTVVDIYAEGDGVVGTDKMEVSSGFVSSGTLSSAEEGPRGLPLVNRPIISNSFDEAERVTE